MRVLALTILFAIAGVALASAQTPPVTPQATPPPADPQRTTPTQPANPTQQDLLITRPRTDTPVQTAPGTRLAPGIPQTGVPATPGQNVGSSTGAAPATLPADPPPIAPNFEAPVRPLPSAERVGVDIANQLPLTLEEVIEMALRNNNDIDTSRNDVQIAEFNFRGARGVYDPIFGAETFYESRTTPTASTIGGAVNGSVTQSQFFGNAGVTGFSPIQGGRYTAGLTSSRTNTSNLNATLNPQFPTDFTATYTQPLLRGRRFDINRRNIEIARKNLSLTDSQFRQRAIEVIALAEQAYWNLAFALRNLQVQIDAVKQARLQLESNQRQVDRGVLAPIDVIAATGQITTFEQSVYTAQEDVTRAENTLKTLMLAERTSETWSRPITPISPISLDPPRIGLEVAVSEAIANRPELTQLETNKEINRIDERYFRAQTKPQIDLVGSYTAAGLAGAATPPRTTTPSALTTRVNDLSLLAGLAVLPTGTTTSSVPPNLVGGYFASLGNLFAQDYPTYRVGVVVSLPWGNTTAKANLGRTLVERTRIENLRAQAEQLIEAEVRNSLQALRSAEARLASALASRESAEKLSESEQRQFRSGTTTFYLVLQRQTELLAARGRELQAQTDLNKAISEFQRSTGTTLTANNVTVSTTGNRDLTVNKKISRFFK
ncbi:MAG: TolC family protein [Pyrinomonadaceae bacterium]